MDINSITATIESVSKAYAEKYGITRDSDWFILKLQEELGELIQSYLMMQGQARTKDKSPQELTSEFQDELADVFCHVLLLANYHNVDIDQKIKDKWLIWQNSQSRDDIDNSLTA